MLDLRAHVWGVEQDLGKVVKQGMCWFFRQTSLPPSWPSIRPLPPFLHRASTSEYEAEFCRLYQYMKHKAGLALIWRILNTVNDAPESWLLWRTRRMGVCEGLESNWLIHIRVTY
jgi:hypothetical protein